MSDLKLCNILCGLQGHSSAHSCLYCEIVTKGKDEYQEPADGSEIPLRTIGRCNMWFNKFMAHGGKKPNAKQFKNCVHPPMIKGSDDTPILLLIPPPEVT